MLARPIRLFVAALLSLVAAWAHAATLQLVNPTVIKSAPVRVQYAQVPTNLPPGQMIQLMLVRFEGNKEDQVYVHRLDLAKGDAGVHEFAPAYFPGRYEVRLFLVSDQRRELARVPLQVVEQTPAASTAAPGAPTPNAAAPSPTPAPAPAAATGAVPAGPRAAPASNPPSAPQGAACAGTPAVVGSVPSGAPSPTEIANALRGVLAERYAPIAGSAADVCVDIGPLTYRGQQDRKMLAERTAPMQSAIRSWVVATQITLTIRKRQGTEVKQRGGQDEVFLFFRDGASWDFRTGRP